MKTPVINYLPELSTLYDESLTIEILIQLRAGFPRFYKKEKKKDLWTSQEILELYSKCDNIKYKPGERVLGDNLKPTAAIMDLILLRATGKGLSKYIEEEIFTPAKMSNSGFLKDNEKAQLNIYGRKTNGYVVKNKKYKVLKGYTEAYTTLEDYTKFYQALDSGVFLSKESMDYYYSPFMEDTKNKYKNEFDGYYTLGGYICQYKTLSYRVYYTGGGMSGGAYIPDLDIRVFMISNYYKDDITYKVYNSILPILGVI